MLRKRKKKVSIILIAFVLIVSQWNVMAILGASNVFGENAEGTSENPILISTADELDNIRHDLDKYYKLDADIDLSGFENWIPIGTVGNAFTGSLDGNGYHIRNVKLIDASTNSHIGFFGFIHGGEINNLTLENVQIEIDQAESNVFTGSLAGEIDGAWIDNVHISSGSVSGGKTNTGGFAGKITEAEISNSSANITVQGLDFIGGFAGVIKKSEIENSYSLGNVDADSDRSYDDGTLSHPSMGGGFVGQLDNSTLQRVFADGDVSGIVAYSGGLVGQSLGSDSQIIDAYATGDVKHAEAFMGGLIGHNLDVATINRTLAVGAIEPDGEPKNAGGLIGLNESETEVSSSYWKIDNYKTSDGGTGLTTSEMRDYLSFEGWDTKSIWFLNGGDYPVLRLVENMTIEPNDNDGVKLQNNAVHFDEINETYHLKTIIGLYPNGLDNYPIMDFVTFTSSDSSVATVNSDGVITAKKSGVAEIYVQHPGRTLVLHIYVHEELSKDYALKFDGKQDGTGAYVKVRHDEALKNTKNFTVEAWVNWDGTDGCRVFLSKPRTATESGWAFVINDGRPEFHAQLEVPNVNNPIRAFEQIEPNTWNHLAFSYNGSSGDAKIYVNGENEDTTFWGLTSILQSDDTPLLMGREFENHLPERSFGGFIDNVRIWDTVLSDAAIADWTRRTNLRKHPNQNSLAGYWNFIEGDGDIAGDSSRYGNIGMLKNNTIWVDREDDMRLFELNHAITMAEQKLIDHPEGSEIGEAPPEAIQDLQQAIDDAKEIAKNSVGKTDEEIEIAVNVLETAIGLFEEKVVSEQIEFAGGEGMIESPYLIETPDQLNKVRGNLTAHYKLIADIDLADWDWVPIGTEIRPFQGGFDGNGKVISNLTIDLPDQNGVGLFGIIGGSGIKTYIKNTGLENVNIKGNRFVGSLVGWIKPGGSGGKKVSNSYVKNGNVTASHGTAGGLIGSLGQAEELQDAYAMDVKVVGSSTVGGLIGNQNGNIENVFAIGEVNATYLPSYNVGGLVGHSSGNANNTYWNASCNSCDFTNSIGEEKDIVDLKKRDTFRDWDFDSTWLLYDEFDMTARLQVFHPLEELNANIEMESVAEDGYFFPEDTAQIHVSARHKGFNAFDLTESPAVKYEVISGTDVIEVTKKGKITAVKPGTARIRVQLGTKVKELSIEVDRSAPEVPRNLIVPGTAQTGDATVRFTWDEPNSWGVGEDDSYDFQFYDGSNWKDSVSLEEASYEYKLPKNWNTDEAKFRVRSVTDREESEFVESTTFTIDSVAPTIEFETNGSEAWSQSAATKVILNDNLSGINTDSLYHVWSQTLDDPVEGDDWEEFSKEEELRLDKENGDWFLHVKVKDDAGNETFGHSKRFRLDNRAPTKPEITPSHDGEEWITNPPVNVTVTAGEDEENGSGIGRTEYRTRLEGDEWSDWKPVVDEPFSIIEDGITNIEAKTIDVARNESEAAKETIKIDTQIPNKPNIELSKDGWSPSRVEVTIKNDGETASGHDYIEYTDDLDAADWTKYEDTFPIDANGKTTIYARAVSKAGNISDIAEAIVKIDKGKPKIKVKMITTGDDKEYVSGSWANQEVQFSAEIINEISESKISEFMVNFGNVDFDGSITFSDEGKYEFILIQAINEAGGLQTAGPFDVFIDKTAPGAPTIESNTTKWTNEPVTVEIAEGMDSGESGVAKTEYKIGEKGQWNEYDGSFPISDEGEHYIYARTWDKAGNVTPDDNLAKTVVRIANSKPSISVDMKTKDGKVYKRDAWTNQTVTLEADFQAETSVPLTKEYSVDGGNTWEAYKETISISKEGKTNVQFRAQDKAGNVAKTVERTVKIDRSLPSEPTIDLSHDDWTNEAVTVTLTAGNDKQSGPSHVIYRIGNGEWLTYKEPFKIRASGETKITAKTVDRATNKSGSASTSVFIEQRSPNITLNGEKTIIMEKGTTYRDEEAKASHKRFGKLTDQIMTESDLDPNKSGTYKITYTVVDPAGNKVTATRTIHVLDIKEITVDNHSSLVEINDTIQLNVNPKYSEELVPSITHTPIFRTNDQTVATVDKNGLVHFLKAGKVTISVTYGSIQEKLDFTVDNGFIDLSEKREVLPGGTYTIQETGAEIRMPVDLPEGTMVTVEQIDAGETIDDKLILAGDSLTVTFHLPEGAPLPKESYTLVMSYSDHADPNKISIYYYNEKTKKWEYRGGDVDQENRQITLDVPHFSTYAVFEKQDNDENNPPNDTENNGNDAKENPGSKDKKNPNEISENGSKGGDQVSSGNKTPKTATSMYDWLLWGMVLLLVGLVSMFVRKRKAK